MSDSRFNLSTLPPLGAFLVERTGGNKRMLTVMRELLDAYLEEGQQLQFQTDEFADPYQWLAITDQLEVVQTFRNILGEG